MSNEPDNVNSGALATIIVLVALSTLAVALVVTALVRDETAFLEAKHGPTQSRSFESLRFEQEAKMNAAPSWVDREKGVARIPVASAMAIVLENVRANPLEMSPGSPPPEEKEEAVDPNAPVTGETPAGEEKAEEGTEASATPTSPAPAPTPKLSAPAPSPAPAASPAPAPSPAPGGATTP
jgi:hypothetical protein